jgi:demethylmenaquinone methyltransferase/2-methoxy-6-polyprenyl-1,4-benzoquinol methylase
MRKLTVENIHQIYTQTIPAHYDRKLGAGFQEWRARALDAANLQPGEEVIVFCCGTGQDFYPILEKIGENGRILGIDFSPQMLALARKRIEKEGWTNIELLEADVTEFANRTERFFDAGVCTLGISLIPAYRKAYDNLLSHVKPGGEIIISDMHWVGGWRVLFNPWLIRLGREFGTSSRGHRNSQKLLQIMKNELKEVRSGKFFHDFYFFCVGKKNRP